MDSSMNTGSLRFFAYDSEVGFERFNTEAEARKFVQDTAVRLKREQIQLVVDGDVVGTGVAARKGLLQGHLLEKSD